MKLSKQDIADRTKLSIGKIKNYIKLFPEYFEELEVSGSRHPVYSEDAIKVANIIATMIKKHNHDDIRDALNREGYSPVVEMIAIDDSNRAVTLEQNELLKLLEEQNKIIRLQRDIIDEQRRLLDHMENDKDSSH